MAYTSIIDWITGVYSQHGWADPIQANPYYPFGDAYNLPYDIGMKLWNIIGGAIAWLLDQQHLRTRAVHGAGLRRRLRGLSYIPMGGA